MIELKQVTKEYGRATVLKNITLMLDCLLYTSDAADE